MKSIKRAILYGLAIWAIPFVVAMFIFPLRNTDRPLFESIMPVTVTFAAVLFSWFYFNKVETGFIKEGILLGTVFFAVSIAIDLLMFSYGPMAMPFLDYMKDIGITYLLIPVITIGFGYVVDRKRKLWIQK